MERDWRLDNSNSSAASKAHNQPAKRSTARQDRQGSKLVAVLVARRKDLAERMGSAERTVDKWAGTAVRPVRPLAIAEADSTETAAHFVESSDTF